MRPRIDGIPGTWSAGRKFTWQAAAGGGSVATLDPAADTDTGLMPRLSWAPVTGATIYRVDIAADPQFNSIVESQLTESTSWTPRAPLRDNQVGTGYWWRVVWGNGFTTDSPGWMVDEDLVAKDQFRKQTRVTLGQPANGGVVTTAPLLTWSAVQGVARFEVELSQDGQFGSNKRSAIVWGTGVVPGNTRDGDARLPDGTWNWRVRAVDGAGSGQTWSPVGQFTLNSPRPAQKEPNDGEIGRLLAAGAVGLRAGRLQVRRAGGARPVLPRAGLGREGPLHDADGPRPAAEPHHHAGRPLLARARGLLRWRQGPVVPDAQLPQRLPAGLQPEHRPEAGRLPRATSW